LVLRCKIVRPVAKDAERRRRHSPGCTPGQNYERSRFAVGDETSGEWRHSQGLPQLVRVTLCRRAEARERRHGIRSTCHPRCGKPRSRRLQSYSRTAGRDRQSHEAIRARKHSEEHDNSMRGGWVGGNVGTSTRSSSTSKPFGVDAERRQAL